MKNLSFAFRKLFKQICAFFCLTHPLFPPLCSASARVVACNFTFFVPRTSRIQRNFMMAFRRNLFDVERTCGRVFSSSPIFRTTIFRIFFLSRLPWTRRRARRRRKSITDREREWVREGGGKIKTALIAWFLNMFFHPLGSINHWILRSVMKLRRECLMASSTRQMRSLSISVSFSLQGPKKRNRIGTHFGTLVRLDCRVQSVNSRASEHNF